MRRVTIAILLLLSSLQPSAGNFARDFFSSAKSSQDFKGALGRDASAGGALDRNALKAKNVLPSKSAPPTKNKLFGFSPPGGVDSPLHTVARPSRAKPIVGNPTPTKGTDFLSKLSPRQDKTILKVLQRKLGFSPKKAWTIDDLPERKIDYDNWWRTPKPTNKALDDHFIKQWIIDRSNDKKLQRLGPYKLKEIPYLKDTVDTFNDLERSYNLKAKQDKFTAQIGNVVQEMLKLNVNKPKDEAVFAESVGIMSFMTNPAKELPTTEEMTARNVLALQYPKLDAHLEALNAKGLQRLLWTLENFHA